MLLLPLDSTFEKLDSFGCHKSHPRKILGRSSMTEIMRATHLIRISRKVGPECDRWRNFWVPMKNRTTMIYLLCKYLWHHGTDEARFLSWKSLWRWMIEVNLQILRGWRVIISFSALLACSIELYSNLITSQPEIRKGDFIEELGPQ